MTAKTLIAIFDSIPTWVMLFPTFICSVILLAVFVERMVFFRTVNIDYRLFLMGIISKLNKNSVEEALAACSTYRGPLIEMVKKILSSWNDIGNIEFRIRDISEITIRTIERFATLVATIGTIAPMFGLLGTVTGMMKSFSGLTEMGPGSKDLLAQGITEALVTTAFGLMVAIPAIIFYNYLVAKAELYAREIEYIANVFLESKNVIESENKTDTVI